jgi:glycosyltransferase involved in cell wall biosynthesis
LVIASSGGGLPEAIGPCGVLFENGDPKMLADQLESLLINNSTGEFRNPTLRLLHLEKHTPFRIAKEYLLLFEQILATRCR